MRKILGLTGALVFSSIAWWLGEKIHFVVAILLSAMAAAYGFYLGQRWYDENLD